MVATLAAVCTLGYMAWIRSQPRSVEAQTAAAVPATSVPAAARLHRDQLSLARPASVDLARKTMAFEALKLRAKRGDPVAQRELAQAYDTCFMAAIRSDAFTTDYDVPSRLLQDPFQGARMRRIAREREVWCKSVDGGAIIPSELIKGWFEQAAKNGDLGGQAMTYAYSQKIFDEAGANQFLERVVGSNDPAAVFLMGSLAGGTALKAADHAYSDVVTGPAAGLAWMAVGCRMGYDCGPSSDLMGSMCLNMGICGEQDFEEAFRSTFSSDEEMQAFDQKVEEISRLVRERSSAQTF